MRSNEFMERIILEELETFKRKGQIATAAVNEYLASTESRARQLIAYNIQSNFKALQELIQESCKTLDQVTIGLATRVPSNGNCSRSIENSGRPMITSNMTPVAQWSSSEGSVRVDNDRIMGSSSPDIVETNGLLEQMNEPSSSSGSSTTSLTRAPLTQRMMGILKQPPRRSTYEDEFAMEIPESSRALNVDAPEFKPVEFPIVSPKSGFSQTSPDNNTAGKTALINNKPSVQLAQQGQPDTPKIEEKREPQQAPSSGDPVPPETDANASKVITSSSSVESFLTASATDSEASKEDEQNKKKQAQSAAGPETFTETSTNGHGVRDSAHRLAPNCYPNGAESRPSSICTKTVIDDTKQVLEGAARALRESYLEKEDESLPTSDQTMRNNRSEDEQTLKVTAEGELKDQDTSAGEEQFHDALDGWSKKQTEGDIPRTARKTRIPPLWEYVCVSFSEINVETGRVYVQMLADEMTITDLSKQMSEQTMASKPPKMTELCVDVIVIAPYQDGKYRAKIVSMESEDNIEVFFIDYGNKATVRLQDLESLNNGPKKLAKVCRMAIPCELDDALNVAERLEDLPDTAYVCFGNPREEDRETVYRIMDIMANTLENYQDLPEPTPFKAHDDPSVMPYEVVVTQATSPNAMWLVETEDMTVSEKVEKILSELPPEPCSSHLATKSSYVAYQGKRAMVTDCREDYLDLLLVDNGQSLKDVPRSRCRRLPLMALMFPRAAKVATLANCTVPSDGPGVEELMKTYVIGKTFEMKVKDIEQDDVILVDPITRKYLARELNSKYAP